MSSQSPEREREKGGDMLCGTHEYRKIQLSHTGEGERGGREGEKGARQQHRRCYDKYGRPDTSLTYNNKNDN